MNITGDMEKGFTIIEILAVLVIIGVIAAMAGTRISSLDNYDVVKETQILKNHLRYAQIRAMSHDEPWGILISGNTYTLQQNGVTAAGNLPNENSAMHTLSGSVSISATAQTITFDSVGSPGSTTINITITGSELNKTFSITRETGFIE